MGHIAQIQIKWYSGISSGSALFAKIKLAIASNQTNLHVSTSILALRL